MVIKYINKRYAFKLNFPRPIPVHLQVGHTLLPRHIYPKVFDSSWNAGT